MFIETHSDKDITLTFIKSASVQAYPCGRRRSEKVEYENEAGKMDEYFFPFDPEARLNTEANNRKQSSLNGFTQTYLKDFDEFDGEASTKTGYLTLVLNGYLFTIKLDADCQTANDFGNEVLTAITQYLTKKRDDQTDPAIKDALEAQILALQGKTRIYANILLEDMHLFSGFKEYYTSVLRNQSASINDLPETSLDLLNNTTAISGKLERMQDFNNYYFSGLSFSVVPLTMEDSITRSSLSVSFTRGEETIKQLCVSLCLLEKTDALDVHGEPVKDDTTGETVKVWKIHEPARLPDIRHGDTINSVIVGELEANSLTTPEITVPYETGVETAIDKSGIRSPYIEAEQLMADDVAVSNKVGIIDSSDSTKLTTIIDDNIHTVNNISADKDISAGNNITAENNISSTNGNVSALEITANSALYQKNDNDQLMQVPIIELVEHAESNVWQLKITRIGNK